MGKEAQVRAHLEGGEDQGRLLYEPPKLIFRGQDRHVWETANLAGVQAQGTDLVLPDGARFTLGEKQAATWAHAIQNPPSRLTKLGVKAGMRVAVAGLKDPDFDEELARVVRPVAGDNLDLLIYAADSPSALAALPNLIPRLAPKGAIWIVSQKGKAAPLKEGDVRGAARTAGLVDTKVCAFSLTLTATRFSRRAQGNPQSN